MVKEKVLEEKKLEGSGAAFTEVNISSYPVTPVTGLFSSSCAEIFKLGCFMQKYSDLGVSCRNICQVPFRVTQSEKCILEKVTQMVL